MKLLITGICGFVGSRLALWLREQKPQLEIIGIDNLARPGSETNRARLKRSGVLVRHGDLRNRSDLENIPAVDWTIDAAANPSVLAGVDGLTSSRQLIEHNLYATVNLLEYCRRTNAGLILLSTSRVYSVAALCQLPLRAGSRAFEWDERSAGCTGATGEGIEPDFPTTPPLSLYGSSKLASELLALEYSATFNFPVWINRCGVMAGAGQFGTPDQGIFSFWIHSWAQKRPLRFIGFDGSGRQVRDALHPDDLSQIVAQQIERAAKSGNNTFNLGGGSANAMSLAQLTDWCEKRFGNHPVEKDPQPRPFDVPWLIMNNAAAREHFNWAPKRSIASILDEIAKHAEDNPDWLELSAPQ